MNVTNNGYYTTDYLRTKPMPKNEVLNRRQRGETLVYYDPRTNQPKAYYDQYYKGRPSKHVSQDVLDDDESGWSIPYPESVADFEAPSNPLRGEASTAPYPMANRQNVMFTGPMVAHPSPTYSPPRIPTPPQDPISLPSNKQRIKVKIRASRSDPTILQAEINNPAFPLAHPQDDIREFQDSKTSLHTKGSFASSNLVAEDRFRTSPQSTRQNIGLSTKPSFATIQPNENYAYELEEGYDDDKFTNGMLSNPLATLQHKKSDSTIAKSTSNFASREDVSQDMRAALMRPISFISSRSSLNVDQKDGQTTRQLSKEYEEKKGDQESEEEARENAELFRGVEPNNTAEKSNIYQGGYDMESDSDDPDYLESEMLPIELNLLGNQRKKVKNMYSEFYKDRTNYEGPTHFKPTHFRQVFEDEAASHYNPIEFVFTDEEDDDGGAFMKLFKKFKKEKEDPDSDDETRALETARIEAKRQMKIEKKEAKAAARLQREKAERAERIAKARAAGRPVKIVKKVVKKKPVAASAAGAAETREISNKDAAEVASVNSKAASKATKSSKLTKTVSKAPTKASSKKATTKQPSIASKASKADSKTSTKVSNKSATRTIAAKDNPRPKSTNSSIKETKSETNSRRSITGTKEISENDTEEEEEGSEAKSVVSSIKSFAKSLVKTTTPAASSVDGEENVDGIEERPTDREEKEIGDDDLADDSPEFHPIWKYILSWIVYENPEDGEEEQKVKSTEGSREIEEYPQEEADLQSEVSSTKAPLSIEQLKEKTKNTLDMLTQPASSLFDKSDKLASSGSSISSGTKGLTSKKPSTYTLRGMPSLNSQVYDPDIEYEFEFDEDFGEPPEQLYRNAITGEIERWDPEKVSTDKRDGNHSSAISLKSVTHQSLLAPTTPVVKSSSSKSINDAAFYSIDSSKPILSNITNLIKQISILKVMFSPIDAVAIQFPNLQTAITITELVIFCWILYELSLVVDAFCVAVKAMCAPIIAIGKLMNRMV